MNVLLSISLWLALVVPSCRGNKGSPQDDNYTPTPTPEYDDDYDYNATFDYYYVTMAHNATNSAEDNEASTTMIIPTEISENKVYNPRNMASRTGQPILVLSLGLAVLHVWN